MKKHTKKGFTLIEMIVVLAILGVLLAVGLIAWNNYIRNARLKSANNKAKVIFNAAQTEITDMKFSERTKRSDQMSLMRYGETGSEYTGESFDAYPYLHGGTFYYYYDGGTGFICAESGTGYDGTDTNPDADLYAIATPTQKTAILDEGNAKLAAVINKVLDDEETVCKICVEDYNVTAVVVGRYDGDKYIGRYPDSTVAVKTSSDVDLSGEVLTSIQLLSKNAMEHLGKK